MTNKNFTSCRCRLLVNISMFLMSVWLALFITNISYSYYKNVSTNHWKVLGAWAGSYFYIGNKADQKITYPNDSGLKITVNFRDFKQDEYVHKVLFGFKELFKRSMFISLMNEIVGIIALFAFFWLDNKWQAEDLYKRLSVKSYKPNVRSIKITQLKQPESKEKSEELETKLENLSKAVTIDQSSTTIKHHDIFMEDE